MSSPAPPPAQRPKANFPELVGTAWLKLLTARLFCCFPTFCLPGCQRRRQQEGPSLQSSTAAREEAKRGIDALDLLILVDARGRQTPCGYWHASMSPLRVFAKPCLVACCGTTGRVLEIPQSALARPVSDPAPLISRTEASAPLFLRVLATAPVAALLLNSWRCGEEAPRARWRAG